MVFDIINFLRRNFSNQVIINKILQDLAQRHVEIKGDPIQERIVKKGEVYEVDHVGTNIQFTDALLLEDGTSFLLTENDKKIYLEVGNA